MSDRKPLNGDKKQEPTPSRYQKSALRELMLAFPREADRIGREPEFRERLEEERRVLALEK